MLNKHCNSLKEYKSFMILKNFSPRTINTYYQIVHYFLNYCEKVYPDKELSYDLVREFLLHRFKSGLCWQAVNSDYSSIQKYFKNILMLPWSLKKLLRPKKERTLPSILSKEDIIRIIETASTYKLQVILTFIYVTGVRVSEAINIKIEDIDGSRNHVRINKGKGNKDRIILVPPKLITLLREYYMVERPVKYLFNSFDKGRKYSPRSIQRAVYESKKKANIIKKGSVHTLRNCYATHHLEGGTDLVFLQEQMGHKNIKTTIRYIGLCVERQRYINHPIQSMQIRYHHSTT